MNKIELHQAKNGQWFFRTFRSSDIIIKSQQYDTPQAAFKGMFAEAQVMFDVLGYEFPKDATITYVDMTMGGVVKTRKR